MFARRLQGFAPLMRPLSLGLLMGILLGISLTARDAAAQRPFRLSDPFYRDETARRTFFDRYALTGEVSYRSAGTVQGDGLPASDDNLAFRFRFDYELARSLDLSAIFDAVGEAGARRVSLNWLVIKYYRYIEEANSDYAFRLAVDPAADGRVGFPQVDLAFLYTSPLSPVLTTDFALGLRRVNIGYLQLTPPPEIQPGGSFVIRPRPQLLGTRALGTELHGMMNYNLLFDPAGSNLFVNLLVQAGAYDLIETLITSNSGGSLSDVVEASDEGGEKVSFRGGTFWTRFGVEFNRPSYQFSPFLAAPLKQWTPDTENGDWPQARLHFGVQFTLR